MQDIYKFLKCVLHGVRWVSIYPTIGAIVLYRFKDMGTNKGEDAICIKMLGRYFFPSNPMRS